MPTPPGPTSTCVPDAPQAAPGPDRKLARAKYSMSLFVWYFGTNKRQYDDVPHHHQMVLGPRYEGLLTDIFLEAQAWRGLQPLPAPPERQRPFEPGASRATTPSTCWLAGATPGQRDVTGSAKPRPTARACRAALSGPCCRASVRHIVTSRVTTPQQFHDDLLSYKGAAFGMEPR